MLISDRVRDKLWSGSNKIARRAARPRSSCSWVSSDLHRNEINASMVSFGRSSISQCPVFFKSITSHRSRPASSGDCAAARRDFCLANLRRWSNIRNLTAQTDVQHVRCKRSRITRDRRKGAPPTGAALNVYKGIDCPREGPFAG